MLLTRLNIYTSVISRTDRDLKANNVLITNQQYCHEDKESVSHIYAECPVVCKLTDFGLSRSLDAQTQSILQSRTEEIIRGTPVYMAPEIHLGILKSANQIDLKKTDIWSLGILAYAVINPNLINPYYKEADALGSALTMEIMKSFMQSQLFPTHDAKYELHRVTLWWQIEEIFNSCAKFDPNERPAISEIAQGLNVKDPEEYLIVKGLNISQNTALENADSDVAHRIQYNTSDLLEMDHEIPQNDGTNACVYLALKICDIFIRNESPDDRVPSWEELERITEEMIKTLPAKINSVRNSSEKYDPIIAKTILTSNNLLEGNYELSEECVSNYGVFTELGRKELINALTNEKLTRTKKCVGLYTCTPYTFLVGIHNGSFFIVDTHPIGEELGGNGNAILVRARDKDLRSCKLIIQWIIKRLKNSGVMK